MHRPHARLAGDAVHFLQCHHGVFNGSRNPRDKTVRKGRVRFNCGIIDDLREASALLRSGPLPGHAPGQSQDMHLDSVLVHPLAPLIEIEIQRIGIGRRRPSHFYLSLDVGLWSPVRMHVDRDWPNGCRVRWTRIPSRYALCEERGGASAKLEKVAAAECRIRLHYLNTLLRSKSEIGFCGFRDWKKVLIEIIKVVLGANR